MSNIAGIYKQILNVADMTTKIQLIEDIKTSLDKAKNTNILDKQNKYMTASLLKAKNESNGLKKDFIKLAKKYTGIS